VALRAVPDAHFVGQRVVIYPNVHGVVRALDDGKLVVELMALAPSMKSTLRRGSRG
jgi:hypothetical protein